MSACFPNSNGSSVRRKESILYNQGGFFSCFVDCDLSNPRKYCASLVAFAKKEIAALAGEELIVLLAAIYQIYPKYGSAALCELGPLFSANRTDTLCRSLHGDLPWVRLLATELEQSENVQAVINRLQNVIKKELEPARFQGAFAKIRSGSSCQHNDTWQLLCFWLSQLTPKLGEEEHLFAFCEWLSHTSSDQPDIMAATHHLVAYMQYTHQTTQAQFLRNALVKSHHLFKGTLLSLCITLEKNHNQVWLTSDDHAAHLYAFLKDAQMVAKDSLVTLIPSCLKNEALSEEMRYSIAKRSLSLLKVHELVYEEIKGLLVAITSEPLGQKQRFYLLNDWLDLGWTLGCSRELFATKSDRTGLAHAHLIHLAEELMRVTERNFHDFIMCAFVEALCKEVKGLYTGSVGISKPVSLLIKSLQMAAQESLEKIRDQGLKSRAQECIASLNK